MLKSRDLIGQSAQTRISLDTFELNPEFSTQCVTTNLSLFPRKQYDHMPSAETSLGFFQSVWTIFLEGGGSGQSVFDEFVDMVLGAMFTR